MKIIKMMLLFVVVVFAKSSSAQQVIPNGDFKKWGNEYDNCPSGWFCNNDADCKGKVTQADKTGGAKLTVMNCFDPKKDDRSNTVSLSFEISNPVKIVKGKKVKISFDYSYAPIGDDEAYIKIDAGTEEELKNGLSFLYNDSDNGLLKKAVNQHVTCYLNFDPANGKSLPAPQNITLSSLNVSFGIMAPGSSKNTHKGSKMLINHVKFETE